MKEYVDIYCKTTKEGVIHPLMIEWEDGRKFKIDYILDVRRCASLKAGGAGIRYTCRILGKKCFLFHEEDRWFVESKE